MKTRMSGDSTNDSCVMIRLTASILRHDALYGTLMIYGRSWEGGNGF